MTDDDLHHRIQGLEEDNARLRRLLDQQGPTAGQRHQTRNTLAMVRDVVRRSAETSDSVEDYAAHLEGRLDAVFRIQTTIANRPFDGVSLHTLVGDELMVHAISPRDRLSIEGPDILLQPAPATALALALHELATNAIKFGTLGLPQGQLSIVWSVAPERDGQPWLTLDWVETGMGAPVAPARRGFGFEVIEQATPFHLGGSGTLAFAPSGLRCRLHMPMRPWLGRLRDRSEAAPTSGEPTVEPGRAAPA